MEIARAVLRDATAGFPQIPFEIPLRDAPGYHSARFHANEAVTRLRYGVELLDGMDRAAERAPEDMERGRYFLRQGLRHYRRARQLLDELPRINQTLPAGGESR